MTKFFVEEEESIYSNWFRLYAVILFPGNQRRQSQAYDYLYYRFLIKHRKNENFQFGRIPYRRIAIKLSDLIGKKVVIEDIGARRRSSNVAGVVLRLLCTMRQYNIPEPGINKAKSLFSWRYDDKKKKAEKEGRKFSYGISKTYADNCRKAHKDVLPYCAALLKCRPSTADTAEEFEERFDRFLALAHEYMKFCKAYKHARGVGNAKLINPGTLLNVVHSRRKIEVLPEDIAPYSSDMIYEYLLKEFEEHLEEKMVKPTDLNGID
jgi:hypothetical protein